MSGVKELQNKTKGPQRKCAFRFHGSASKAL